MSEKKIIIKADSPNILIIDGKKYICEKQTYKKIDNVEHIDAVIYKEFDEAEHNRCINILIDAISKKTAKKELIMELVKSVDLKSLRRLVKRIENGKAIKKVKGCIGFKIVDAYLQLID